MPCSSTGDTDFLLDIEGIVIPAPLDEQYYPFVMDGMVDIGTTPTLLSGIVSYSMDIMIISA